MLNGASESKKYIKALKRRMKLIGRLLGHNKFVIILLKVIRKREGRSKKPHLEDIKYRMQIEIEGNSFGYDGVVPITKNFL